MSKPSEFSKGTRVTHEFYTSLGTVVGEVRQYRGPGLKDDVEVKFDDGAHDHCHLDFMTVVAPSVHVPKFAIGDRINHFIHGHGTVVGAPRKSNWNNEWCVPVRYDDGMGIRQEQEKDVTVIEHQSTYARNLSATGSELLGRVKQYVVDNE